jgi:hypothetical protein
MNENQETTILQEGLVRITNRRTLIGTQTYPLSDIKSITVIRRGKSARPLWLVLVGAFLLLWSILDQTGYYREFFNWGIFLSVIGLVLVAIATPSYVIQIRNSSGVNDILGSTDRSLIQRIVEAMNKGIASRAADSGGKAHPATRKVSLG